MPRAVRAAGFIIRRYGRHVATEVLGWLACMEAELQAYAGRMASMCDAAIEQDRFDAVCDELRELGFRLQRSEHLVNPQSGRPLVWSLVAMRS